MKTYKRLGFAGLLTAVALVLASCGGMGGAGNGSNGGMDDMDHGEAQKEGGSTGEKSGMENMDDMEGMDGGSGDMSGMLMEDGEYSDERFIDAMVPHHVGAVDMAEVALRNAEHPEIKQLSEDIISTQNAEIQELKSIKEEEFGTSEVPMRMDMQEMEEMGMMMNPENLEKEDPFDKAFIGNMTPHHESAVEMAEVALNSTDNPRIKDLAAGIIESQEREVSQMKQWREEWYPQG